MTLGIHLPMSCRTNVASACLESEAEILRLALWSDVQQCAKHFSNFILESST